MPAANANNKRLNDGVVANVYTVQHQAGCTNDVTISPQLQLAAEWHANDVLNNRALDGDIGSDGSTAQDRANAAGFKGIVAETVAINPALAISGIEIINQWYYRPDYMAIMSNCANIKDGRVVGEQPGPQRRRRGLRPARLARRDVHWRPDPGHTVIADCRRHRHRDHNPTNGTRDAFVRTVRQPPPGAAATPPTAGCAQQCDQWHDMYATFYQRAKDAEAKGDQESASYWYAMSDKYFAKWKGQCYQG